MGRNKSDEAHSWLDGGTNVCHWLHDQLKAHLLELVIVGAPTLVPTRHPFPILRQHAIPERTAIDVELGSALEV